jgi:hypothetical protein
MPEERKKKEISVDTPALRAGRDVLLKDTTGAEAVDVLLIAEKIGRPWAVVMLILGPALCLLSIYSTLSSSGLVFSPPLFPGVLGVLGLANIFCGLLLLAKR